ncbi:MAG: hypothetical protein ACLURV_11255 [Gallintestinimicrobium sp.]
MGDTKDKETIRKGCPFIFVRKLYGVIKSNGKTGSFQERRKRQQARRRLLGKLAAVLIGAVFFLAVQKDGDQFCRRVKKQDSYIGSRTQAIWSGSADCRQEQPTQAPVETTDVARDNTHAAVVSAHARQSVNSDQVLDLMEKFQAESDDGYLTDPGKTIFFVPAGESGVVFGGAYTGTDGEKADWYDWFDRAKESMMPPERFRRRRL